MSTLTRVVSWSAGVIGGVVAGVTGGHKQSVPTLAADASPGGVRRALLGRHRRQIVRALGAPPTASVSLGARVTHPGPVTFWEATTWYYPFDPARQRAIAIRFEGNRARAVDLIGAPE